MLAAPQYGLIDVKAAAQAGVKPAALRTWAARGALVRVSQGVYRMPQAALVGLTQLMAHCLWAHRTEAVLTGEAAAWLYVSCQGEDDDSWRTAGLSVDLIAPRNHRTHRALPTGMRFVRLSREWGDLVVREHRNFQITDPETTLTVCAWSLAQRSDTRGPREQFERWLDGMIKAGLVASSYAQDWKAYYRETIVRVDRLRGL
jgi:hypothetical protein